MNPEHAFVPARRLATLNVSEILRIGSRAAELQASVSNRVCAGICLYAGLASVTVLVHASP